MPTELRDYKPGDVVKLKSATQRMTGEGVSDSGAAVECVWFVGLEVMRAGFLAVTIEADQSYVTSDV